MPTRKEIKNFRNELKKQIRKAGRTQKWLRDKMGLGKVTFWRKIEYGELSEQQKKQINHLLKP